MTNEGRISFQPTSHKEEANPGNMGRKEIRMLNTLHWNLIEEVAGNLASSSMWFIILKTIYMRRKLVTVAFDTDFLHILNNITSV